MLHHASLTARNPQLVARVLAEMLNATVVRAPSPPFPRDSWFTCYGDAGGSFLEVLPWGSIFDPDVPFGVTTDENARPRIGAHVLVSTPRSGESIQAIAAREGWRTQVIDARLFQVLKVWVENATLVELLPPEMAPAYLATFGVAGRSSLDAKLRALEAPSVR